MYYGRPASFNPNGSGGGSPYTSPPSHHQNSSIRPRFMSPPTNNFRPIFSPHNFNGTPIRSSSSMSQNFNSLTPQFSSTPRQYKPRVNDRRSWSSNESYDNNRSSFYSSPEGISPNWNGPRPSPNRTQNTSWQSNRSFGSTIEDFVDPSMLVDPWLEMEQQIVRKNAANSSDD